MAKPREKFKVDPNAWMLTFSDLLTLLLTFFVLLLSMSSLNELRLKEVFGSLQGAVGAFEKGAEVEVGRQPLILHRRLPGKTGSELAEISEQLRKALDLDTPKDFAKTMKIENTEIDIRADEKGAIVAIPHSILFPSGQAELQENGKRALSLLGPVLRSFNNLISVDGHSDDRPPTSDLYPTGWELSMARALSVLHYLVNHENLLPQRFTAVGYGSTRPLEANDTAKGRAANRRVEIVLIRERTFWR